MTRRQEIIQILSKQDMSVSELADMFDVEAKIIAEDMEHIAKSIRPHRRFKIQHARCKLCGFTFISREKIKAPSKCPKCKAELIEEGRFKIV